MKNDRKGRVEHARGKMSSPCERKFSKGCHRHRQEHFVGSRSTTENISIAVKRKDFEKASKNAAIRSVYYRPRSHHVEVAASGDPRVNGDSTNGVIVAPREFESQMLKLQSRT
ncbi:hypothetical protein V1478_011240 [Vespula squamosa]|uniref:Uncharacterized protein n=1 Tax=Vespula squamosa TaxID=30214 RepID=A0ABD2AEI7_VESSQ